MSNFEIYSSPRSPSKKFTSSSPKGRQDLSPGKYDADFYRRKAERLQEDLFTISDQLNRARIRLRRAQDFQLKFQILIKQKCELEETIKNKDRQITTLTSERQTLALKAEQKGNKHNENMFNKQKLLKDVEVWKERAIQAEQKAKKLAVEEQMKASEKNQKEFISLKRTLQQKQESYKYQINRLSKLLDEKQTTDSNAHNRHDKQAKQRQKQIERLQKVLTELRADYKSMLDEKNQEINNVRKKFQQIMNNQLGNLNKNMVNQDSKFKLELQGLRKMIDLKNQDINNLQKQQKISLDDYAENREELNRQIQLLKAKLYERDRQNEQQLFNMKGRLTALHSADISSLKQHYEDLIQNLKDERKQCEKLLEEKDKKVEYQRKEFERGQEELKTVLTDKDKQIIELKQRFSQTGESSNNQIGTLQRTLTKYADQKESLNKEYQSNISFLNQQISKLTTFNQLKNNEIKQLHEYIALLKKEHFQGVKDLEAKWKQERKQRETQRQKERDIREAVEEQYWEKQKMWKNKQRQLEMDLQKQQRQKQKWVAINEKLQKQIERLHKEIQKLEQDYKTEFGKNQNAVVSGGDSKRHLLGELQRQKGDLEALKRMEVDQVKKKYDLEVLRLTNQNQKLQKQLTSKNIQYQKLEDEFKKISSQYKNIDKINKDKMANYQKKMTALNSQILLTQNLYQSLIGAKNKVIKQQQ